ERIEHAEQLQRPAPHPREVFALELDGLVDGHLGGRSARRDAVDEDGPLLDELPRALAGRGEPAPDQQQVQADLPGHQVRRWTTKRARSTRAWGRGRSATARTAASASSRARARVASTPSTFT